MCWGNSAPDGHCGLTSLCCVIDIMRGILTTFLFSCYWATTNYIVGAPWSWSPLIVPLKNTNLLINRSLWHVLWSHVSVFFRFIYCLTPFGQTVLFSGAAHLYVIITCNITHVYVPCFGNLALRALIASVIMYLPCFGNLALRAFIISFIIYICILRFTCFCFPVHVTFFIKIIIIISLLSLFLSLFSLH